IHIVTALDQAKLRRGLLSDYLRHEGAPPDDPASGSGSAWVQDVADSLEGYGIDSQLAYQVGPHLIDLVVGENTNAIAVECHPHPDGAQAHLHRRQALARVGWTITDVFPSRWVLDADGAALHVKTVLESNRGFSSD
ncbi:MAG: hypothetical protein OEY55_15635, partial [Acidimicrobiia bacterium]|nr:hypothetical protein [Acidimicrobiia bacterium]